MKSDAEFEEKLTCGLENDMRSITNIYSDLDGIFLSKVENVWT